MAVLMVVALLAASTVTPMRMQATRERQEREAQLLWVGEQYRQAIESYYRATPGPVPAPPHNLEELLADPRFAYPVRHLRRLYADPMTGDTKWGLVLRNGGIVGVASRSKAKPLKVNGFSAQNSGFSSATAYSEWVFQIAEGGVPAVR
jgi:type II secretory pathway pseudopilin PulG